MAFFKRQPTSSIPSVLLRLLVVTSVELEIVLSQTQSSSGPTNRPPVLISTTSASYVSSGAMIGIVIASICVLLIVIGALTAFFVCRKLKFQNKPTDTGEQTRQAQQDLDALQESGCGLPVDIPVEALTREPPPRYCSVDNLAFDSDSFSEQRHADEDPPPYNDLSMHRVRSSNRPYDRRSAPFVVGSGRNFDAPPAYQSRVELDVSRLSVPERSSSVRTDTFNPALLQPFPLRAGSVATTSRLHSIDSFQDIPSMSDVLLTSSRTSLPTSASSAAAMDAANTNAAAAAGARSHGSVQSSSYSLTAHRQSEASGRSATSSRLPPVSTQTPAVAGRSSSGGTAAAEVPVAQRQSVNGQRRVDGGQSRDDRRSRQQTHQPSGPADATVAYSNTPVRESPRTRATGRNSSNMAVPASDIQREPQSTTSRRNIASGEVVLEPRQSTTTSANVHSRSSTAAKADGATPAAVDDRSSHRNNRHQGRSVQSSSRSMLQNLPRMSSVQEEQPAAAAAAGATSSTLRLDHVDRGSVV